MEKKRDISFDIMKGIGIILMLLAHDPRILGQEPYYRIVFSFHMPLFFIISGYFFNSNKSGLSIIKNNSRRLLVPYLITVCMIFFFFILGKFLHSYFRNDFVSYVKSLLWNCNDRPIWFLIALFWCKILFFYLDKYINKWGNVIIFVVSFVSTLCAKYFLLPFCVLQGMSAMLFFYMGYKWKNIRYRQFIVPLLFLFWIVGICYSHVDMRIVSYGMFPIDVLGACGGTIFIYYLSKYIEKIQCLAHVMAEIGILSMAILCFHTMFTFLVIECPLFFDRPYYVACFMSNILPILCAIIVVQNKVLKSIFI